MREMKRLAVHALLLIAAAVAAFAYAGPKEGPGPLKPGEVELWSGSHKDVTRITYETSRQMVMLERKEDDTGLWYLGKVEPVDAKEEPEPEAADAGADGGPPSPHKPKPVEPATFAAVSVAEKIVKALAPLRAARAIGEVDGEREKVFGLDKPEGTLTVEVGSKKHVLIIGGNTPGAGSRYVRDADTKLVYVIDAQPVRDLDGGSARLSERSMHGWKFAEIERATVIGGDKSRIFVKGGAEGKQFWAASETPDTNDETVNNWLRKVENLRPVKFVEALPENAERVLRVDYGTKGDTLGYLELYRYQDEEGKDEFAIKTEYLRMPSTVAKTLGEQVIDDLPSLFPVQ